jgi:hypothetical protein
MLMMSMFTACYVTDNEGVALSNAERQTRWRERRSTETGRISDVLNAYRQMVSRILQLRSDIERRSDSGAAEYARFLGWINGSCKTSFRQHTSVFELRFYASHV